LKIQIEKTDEITAIDGVRVRRWAGEIESGGKCDVFVHRIRVEAGGAAEFASNVELDEKPVPFLGEKAPEIVRLIELTHAMRVEQRSGSAKALALQRDVDELLDKVRGQKRLF